MSRTVSTRIPGKSAVKQSLLERAASTRPKKTDHITGHVKRGRGEGREQFVQPHALEKEI